MIYKLYDYLPFWNKEEREFKIIIGDLSRPNYLETSFIGDTIPINSEVATDVQNARLQYPYTTSVIGLGFSIVNNSAGVTDANGFKVTITHDGLLNMSVSIRVYNPGSPGLASSRATIYKNGSPTPIYEEWTSNGPSSLLLELINESVLIGDFFTIVFTRVIGNSFAPSGGILEVTANHTSDPIEITNINDLNIGATHNALYWHKNFQERAVYETNILNATGIFLEWFGEITKIPKPYPMTDAQYAQYIIDTINSETITLPDIHEIFNGFDIRMSPEYPCWADQCFSDVGVLSPSDPNYHKSSVVCHWNDAVYVFMNNINLFTQEMRARLLQGVAAGTGIFIGIY